MGFFDKFFGKNNNQPQITFDTAQLKKTAKMMPEDQFWSLVKLSFTSSHESQEAQKDYLIRVLTNLTPEQIIGFRLRTDKLLYDTYTSEMWCAGYVMIGGCSDDSFEYFRLWIISQGKDVYYAAKENPDSLVQFNNDEYDFDFETFWYVANNAFEKKTGKDLDDYIDSVNFTTAEGNYPEIVFNWSEEEEESMKKICPKLFEKFWEQ